MVLVLCTSAEVVFGILGTLWHPNVSSSDWKLNLTFCPRLKKSMCLTILNTFWIEIQRLECFVPNMKMNELIHLDISTFHFCYF